MEDAKITCDFKKMLYSLFDLEFYFDKDCKFSELAWSRQIELHRLQSVISAFTGKMTYSLRV